MPNFVEIDTEETKYVKLPPGELQQPLLPDNFEELKSEEKEKARAEFKQVTSKQRFMKIVRQLHPALYGTLQTFQVELLRRAIYYSSHSWSDGLPLLEKCLMAISMAYGNTIPADEDYPTCPVLFSEEDVKRHEKDFKDVVYIEEWLDVHISNLMKTNGILVHRDGDVDVEDFEEGRKKAEELLATFMEDMDEEPAAKMRRHWPMREGKFVHSMESCV